MPTHTHTHRAREELRKRTNLNGWQDKMIIAVVSRLTPQKGVHLIKYAAYKVSRVGGGCFTLKFQCVLKPH
jgi:glycogen synthase